MAPQPHAFRRNPQAKPASWILSLLALIFIVNSLFGALAGWLTAPASVGLTVFILLVKLLVSFIQAYVFTILSALFIGMAVEEHHHEDEEHLPGSGPAPAAEDHSHVTPHMVAQDDTGTVEDRTRVPELETA